MLSKKYAAVDKARCAACGACAGQCPRGAVSVWRGCYAQVDKTLCVGCGMCARICPVGCIALVERGGSCA